MGSQQGFIGFANFYQRFIQGFSKIATSLTTMLKTSGLFVALAFRVDDDEVVGDGGGAGAGRSIVERNVGSIVHNHPEYPEDKESVHPSLRPQKAGLIAEEAPTKVSVKYANFADVSSPNLASELLEHTKINDYAIELVDTNGSSDHPIHPQILPSFSTGSRTDPFGCMSIRSLNNLTMRNGYPLP